MPRRLHKLGYLLAPVVLIVLVTLLRNPVSDYLHNPASYTGSANCRKCHEDFYELWATSHHGLAMQPYTPEFARRELQPQSKAIRVGQYYYTVQIGEGRVHEIAPNGSKTYTIAHVLGGRNVYYFLTPMDRGRLQVLPLAFDVQRKQWFDTAASAVRHFPGAAMDAPLHWTDSFYTFNTSCYGCHVSQLSTNYDLATDTYHTTWAEPGINCETCHGPGQEHVKICLAASEAEEPEDLKIISTKIFTAEQTNSLCASCHAKLSPISLAFQPSEHYFDHFDLITLEHPDFYPDGRDLGENYTYTTWRMSPCANAGKLDCMHCHTSSGRYRFAETEVANNACLPCHKERVASATAHTHHAADSEGNKCVTCHMPTTEFARMTRSDHSMRPPTPAATLDFNSPNACNLCHADEDAAWADKYVRQWHKDDYQQPVLNQAHLVHAARNQDWTQLDSILEYIGRPNRDEVIATSLVRLLRNCNSQKKWPVIIRVLQEDTSALVRAAAAEVLGSFLTDESRQALLDATRDEYRLVRVQAAASLATVRADMLGDVDKEALTRATQELEAALTARSDDYASHYNLGNLHMERRIYQRAIRAFQTAIRLRPDYMPPYVNIALAYNASGQNDKAEASLNKAIKLDPNSVLTHLNLGMLLGEMGRLREAETAFRNALRSDPNSAVAAYNLGVILAQDRMDEALKWCRKASVLRPDVPKYTYTYAFYLRQSGSMNKAAEILQDMIDKKVPYAEAYFLLGDIYERRGQFTKAREIYRVALESVALSEQQRYRVMMRIQHIQGR